MKKAAGSFKTTTATSSVSHTDSSALALTTTTTEARIDSRLLALQLGTKHSSTFELLKDHKADFRELGKVQFETGASPGSKTGQTERFALLNEDQAYLLLAYSRNNDRTRRLKIKLVKAFSEARKAADMRQTEYLPGFRQLQDAIHVAAAGSANEWCVHSNVAKQVNKAVGLGAGQRASAPVPQLALLIVAQMVATQAMQSALDHHDGYQRVKQSLLALSGISLLGGA